MTEASYVDGTAKVAPDIGSLLGDKVIAFPVAMEAAMGREKNQGFSAEIAPHLRFFRGWRGVCRMPLFGARLAQERLCSVAATYGFC